MGHKILNIKGFSLLEILLASIIFIISIAGVFATLNAMRVPVANKESSLQAAVFGKQVLEALRTQVNSSTYYNSCSITAASCPDFSLYLGPHLVPTIYPGDANFIPPPAYLTWPSQAIIQSNNACAANNPCIVYTVKCGDGSANQGSNPNLKCANPDVARRVDLSISWPDAS